jgi:hypothetical protein
MDKRLYDFLGIELKRDKNGKRINLKRMGELYCLGDDIELLKNRLNLLMDYLGVKFDDFPRVRPK